MTHVLSPEQQTTIATYNQTLDLYLERNDMTVAGQEYIKWIDLQIQRVSNNSSILEIGSGTGRDADRIEAQGYKVVRTDVADSFIDYQRSIGKTITKFNPILEQSNLKYDFIFANGVFLHFPPNELKLAFQNLIDSLNNKGLLVFSIKIGDFEGFVHHHLFKPRYEKFWKLEELKKLILECNFEIIEIDSDEKWARVTIQKP
jgi:SAM-dependent methyltransferase